MCLRGAGTLYSYFKIERVERVFEMKWEIFLQADDQDVFEDVSFLAIKFLMGKN